MREDNYISGVQAAMQLWQLFRKLLFFKEMVTRELQKTADMTPTTMQKQRQRCLNIQNVIKRQCLPKVFIGW